MRDSGRDDDAAVLDERAAAVVETHVSTLFFVDDVVLKRKKPVRTAFLDFTTVEARREACEREVELNRRLAPDSYLGVAEVALGGTVVDHLVVMRRYPPARRLAARLDRPDVDDDLRALAHLIATFHARAERGPRIDAASGAHAVTALWEASIEQVAPYAGVVLDAAEVERVATLARRYLAGRVGLLDARVRDGHASDGHGDLQAEDVFVLDDGPRVLDCLEFDDRLRYGDELGDVAFLAMDLERLGHPELAASFLAHYRELRADSWPASLGHLHVAHRAHIRAKVACLRHDQGDSGAAEQAVALHALAARHLDEAQVRVVLVGGTPGTGKSTVSRALGDRLDAVVLSSDEIRDELIERGGDRYETSQVERVYDELLTRAGLLVGRGESVVLDASWLGADRRARARALAAHASCVLTEVCCRCAPEVAEARIRHRLAAGGDHSEATVDVARRLAATADPWPEAHEVDTSGDAADVAFEVEALVRRS